MSFVILTSKDGVFRTEADDALAPVETYHYFFYGQRRAEFVIAALQRESHVRIVSEDGAPVNQVRTKFLEHFDTVEDARKELDSLLHYGRLDVSLRKVA